jgi:hypothetical protein
VHVLVEEREPMEVQRVVVVAVGIAAMQAASCSSSIRRTCRRDGSGALQRAACGSRAESSSASGPAMCGARAACTRPSAPRRCGPRSTQNSANHAMWASSQATG